MLVLSRKPGEKLVITGGITISVLEVVGRRVKLGIEAPNQFRVLRAELARWLEPDEAPRAPAAQQDSPEEVGPGGASPPPTRTADAGLLRRGKAALPHPLVVRP